MKVLKECGHLLEERFRLILSRVTLRQLEGLKEYVELREVQDGLKRVLIGAVFEALDELTQVHLHFLIDRAQQSVVIANLSALINQVLGYGLNALFKPRDISHFTL